MPLHRVDIRDGFWSGRQQLVRDVVIPYQWDALNDRVPGAEPSHTIENFRIAAGEAEGRHYGLVFQDSDLSKWLETVGFALSVRRDPDLERIADDVIELLGRAQMSDGYLNSYYQLNKPDERWTDLRHDHELYCAGHYFEAAVAYYEATGKRKALDVVCRLADHLLEVFGTGDGQLKGYPGHPEVELALVKLHRATGKDEYLALSKYFVDERGSAQSFFELETQRNGKKPFHYDLTYMQAHIPVREQRKAEGHAVRAVYLYSAMADLAAAYSDGLPNDRAYAVEDSMSAMIREVKEEINLDIIDSKLLGIVENIFPWYGEVGHEFDFIYEARLHNKAAYENDVFKGVEGEKKFIAFWKELSDFKDNPSYKLVPDGLYEMLSNEGKSECIKQIKHINTKEIKTIAQ